MLSYHEAISEIMHIGESADHQYEQVPRDLASALVNNGLTDGSDHAPLAWGPGLLAMLQVANWGQQGMSGDDPAGKDWKGTGPRSGKHLLDGGSRFPWGGLGIVHLDSSGLYEKSYAEFGEPYGGAMQERMHFNALLASGHRKDYLDWADTQLAKTGFHKWLMDYWLRKFWEPAWGWVATIYSLYPHESLCKAVELAAVSARIANSVSGVARSLRTPDKATVEAQIEGYVEYKRDKRGDSSADRAQRQANYALRVGVIFRELRTEAF